MAHNLLAMMQLIDHLSFGLNISFQRLGLKPSHISDNFSSETLMGLSRLILLSRSAILIFLSLRLLQKEGFPCNRRHIHRRLIYVIAPCFSLKPRYSSFKLFAMIKGDPTYSICRIEILQSKSPDLLCLQLKTLCGRERRYGMDIIKWMELMPYDDKILTINLKNLETRFEKGPKATQNSFSISAIQGEYSAHRAHGEIEKGSVIVTFREKKSQRFIAHSHSIDAIAFHSELPLLATYNGVDKELKIWHIPSKLFSNPVLISILKVPDSCVLSIAFHPKFPLVIIGKINGSLEVWRAA